MFSRCFRVANCARTQYSLFILVKVVGGEEGDKPKTAFITEFGLFEFNVMSFGLTNAPATFHPAMEKALKGIINEHYVHVRTVLERIRLSVLSVNWEKCEWFVTTIEYLGHIISEGIVRPSETKVEVLYRYDRPKTLRQLQSFLGLANHYRRFVKGFAEIAGPLHQATEKSKNFEWYNDCQKSFDELRQYLTVTDGKRGVPVLPDFEKEFRLETDANPAPRLTLWLIELRLYEFDIEYRQGHENGNADALSRWLLEEEESETETYPNPGFVVNKVILQEVEFNENQLEDGAIAALYSWRFRIFGKNVYRNYDKEDDGLHFQYVVPRGDRETVLKKIHDYPLGGHLGVDKTTDKLKVRFYWQNYLKDIAKYIQQCEQCALVKAPRVYTKQPIVPIRTSRPFQMITWDILGPLPMTEIERLRTSACHPQCDGETERFNRTLEQMLACYTQKKWDQYLSKLAFAYNTAVHNTTENKVYVVYLDEVGPKNICSIKGLVDNKTLKLGLDCGATNSIMNHMTAIKNKIEILRSNLKIRTANGEISHISGITKPLEVNISGYKGLIEFLVFDHEDHDVLLGLDWFNKTGYGIFPSQGILKFKEDEKESKTAPIEEISDIFHTEIASDNEYFWDTCDLKIIPASDLETNQKNKFSLMANKAKGLFAKSLQELDKCSAKIIRPSWSSPVVVVRKIDNSMRVCIDYRKLNKITHTEKWPIPDPRDIFDRLRDSAWFTLFDLKSGYYQIEMDEESINKTAFSTPDGHYEYLLLPFGLKNAPIDFSRVIKEFLGDLIKFVEAFIDDITIHSKTFEEHLEHIKIVLNRLKKAKLKLNPDKCVWCAKSNIRSEKTLKAYPRDLAIGGVLTQIDDDGQEYIVACYSRLLNKHEKKYWSLELMFADLTITYRPGKIHQNADALSRPVINFLTNVSDNESTSRDPYENKSMYELITKKELSHGLSRKTETKLKNMAQNYRFDGERILIQRKNIFLEYPEPDKRRNLIEAAHNFGGIHLQSTK
ncbi:unnamed protein product [Brachionus calyciflorus]|uniref:RNA-directed DNA polymerase n=1 Tax=Brachionus calyciflorus TaxID=104777 RepID=A0A814C6H1_9BILA|nr:unnamed protein product [Brachionus calyciflorus]